ncbi:MAG: hypothetical protein R3C26_05630 [Calditrichia bacterium]
MIYDTIGGMKAVVYSDVVQMVIFAVWDYGLHLFRHRRSSSIPKIFDIFLTTGCGNQHG